MDPERFLPAVVLPWIKPQTKPWALVDVPFYGKPLHNELRAKISSPVTQGGQLGSLLGNFTTVGTSLVLLRTLAMSALPPYMKFAFSPILIGQILGSLGRSEETERVYAKYQEDQAKLWFWNRSYRQSLAGMPKTLVYMDYQEQETEKLWQAHGIEQATAFLGGLLLFRFMGPKMMGRVVDAWKAGATTGAWRWPNWTRQWKGSSGGSGGSRSSTALVPVIPPLPPALIPYKEVLPAIIRQRSRPWCRWATRRRRWFPTFRPRTCPCPGCARTGSSPTLRPKGTARPATEADRDHQFRLAEHHQEITRRPRQAPRRPTPRKRTCPTRSRSTPSRP